MNVPDSFIESVHKQQWLMLHYSRPIADLSAVLYIPNNRELAHWSQSTRKYILCYYEVQGDFLGCPHGT